ncbi:MAG: hypothetical protein K9G04_05375 [Ilumatobacteraceae bacterium]|nr:hypothetical protein [Ilumatobacteraceae bacterium]
MKYTHAPSGPTRPSTARGPMASSRRPVITAPTPANKLATPYVMPSVAAETLCATDKVLKRTPNP